MPTASARVRVTVEPLTATGLLVARLTAVPFTFTVKAVPAGTELVFSSFS